MVRISDIKLPVTHDRKALLREAAKKLRVGENAIRKIRIVRRSLDARRKPNLFYVYTADAELKENSVSKSLHNNFMSSPDEQYRLPAAGKMKPGPRPLVIGSGPAGLFAALLLAEAGLKPIILERGEDALTRTKKAERLFKEGILDPLSNVQFGEGGAGTFSDGKLNTSVRDPGFRGKFVKETFVRFGADPEILYDAKPHVGTDVLTGILVKMREYMTCLGAEYRFLSKATGFQTKNGALTAVIVNDREIIPADTAVLSPGHSARDTFFMLHELGVAMEAKPFAAGIRIEHPQEMIDLAQYGRARESLPPASYKLTHQTKTGRGVYSFCMCPGGCVVNASSEPGRLTVNGMSYSKRDSANANSALIVSLNPRDYGKLVLDKSVPEALAGIAFQRKLEEAAFRAAGGRLPQILYGDLKAGRVTRSYGDFISCTKGESAFADVSAVLPDFMTGCLLEGIEAFGKKLRGFDRFDAIITAVEARSSSPVRILRDEAYLSSVRGLYPAGEGAGYAGGIMSAAMDGMRCAEKIIRNGYGGRAV
ncbi:MAG: FAD-dependent monooxygenase [Lachnospiraceae bacterium]|nr:FAD-dependent monooxygenase [Lachnospiraceae bacterium]